MKPYKSYSARFFSCFSFFYCSTFSLFFFAAIREPKFALSPSSSKIDFSVFSSGGDLTSTSKALFSFLLFCDFSDVCDFFELFDFYDDNFVDDFCDSSSTSVRKSTFAGSLTDSCLLELVYEDDLPSSF